MRTLCIALLCLLLVPWSAVAAPARPASDTPVDLEADQLNVDEVSGRYHASGNVRLIQGDLQLTSDQLWWNQQTGAVEANGDVHLTRPGEELSGRKINYNLQQGTGTVDDGEAYWPGKSLRLSARRLERLGPGRFRVYNGRFTVCEGKRPAWSIGSSLAEVTIGRYLTTKHALIYIKDVPVFYLPYLAVSIKSERESGFLMPRIGLSERRGSEFSAAWYQVLGRNMDATFYLDHLSKLGTGTGFEYRYIFGRKQRGRFKLYTVFSRDAANRWALDWEHVSRFGENLRLVVDTEYVNTRDYFTDFGEVAQEYNRQKVISNIFVNQTWGKASLTGQFKYIKDLETADPLPWQSAPKIDFSIAPLRLRQTPFYFSLQSSYDNFERDKGAAGQRLTVRPTVELHSYLLRGLEFNAEYGYRFRQYLQTDADQSASSGSDDFNARLASRIFRVYGSGQRSWLHSIEPEIKYSYAADNQEPRQPDFDRFDHSEAVNSVGYSLASRLSGKWRDAEGGVVRRELLWLRLTQNYNLGLQDRAVNPFSDLRTEMVLRPTANSRMRLDAYFDPELGRFYDTTLSGNIRDMRGNRLQGSYHKREAAENLAPIDNANIRIDTALLKPLYLGYEQRYDLLESKLLEQVIDLDFRRQCWGFKVTLRDREEDRSIMFVLTLGGIGQTADLGANSGGS